MELRAGRGAAPEASWRELQADELREKQERERREAGAEARRRSRRLRPPPRPRSRAGHRRARCTSPRTGDAEDRQEAEEGEAHHQVAGATTRQRRRTIKTRGDAGGGMGGWHGARRRRGTAAQDGADADQLRRADRADRARSRGARDDHRGRARAQDAVKAAEVIKALMKLGTMVDHQPGARPGNGDDRGRGDGPQGECAPSSTIPMRCLAETHERSTTPSSLPRAAGGHRHGPRRPRQDLAARLHPPHARSRAARRAASPSTSAPTTSRRRAA